MAVKTYILGSNSTTEQIVSFTVLEVTVCSLDS
jgi:hypothetical protein